MPDLYAMQRQCKQVKGVFFSRFDHMYVQEKKIHQFIGSLFSGHGVLAQLDYVDRAFLNMSCKKASVSRSLFWSVSHPTTY